MEQKPFKPKGGSRNIDSKSRKPNQSKYIKPAKQQVPPNPKQATVEYKTFSSDPEFAIEEAFNRLVDWIWPAGKQGDTTVLTANRLLGRNDKGFLMEEKAKELIGIHTTEKYEPMRKLVTLASALRSQYLKHLNKHLTLTDYKGDFIAPVNEADALAIINILNQIDRYQVFDIPVLKTIKDGVWEVLTDKSQASYYVAIYNATKG